MADIDPWRVDTQHLACAVGHPLGFVLHNAAKILAMLPLYRLDTTSDDALDVGHDRAQLRRRLDQDIVAAAVERRQPAGNTRHDRLDDITAELVDGLGLVTSHRASNEDLVPVEAANPRRCVLAQRGAHHGSAVRRDVRLGQIGRAHV